jgi:hypothetical protein
MNSTAATVDLVLLLACQAVAAYSTEAGCEGWISEGW